MFFFWMEGQTKYIVLTVNAAAQCYSWFENFWEHEPSMRAKFGDFSYAVGQKERGEAGNLHWQCYFEYHQRARRATFKRRYFPGAHIEPRHGTSEEAAAYCKKDDTGLNALDDRRFEYGTISEPQQGLRTDWDALEEDIRADRTIEEIAERNLRLFVRHHRGIERVVDIRRPTRAWRTQVYILYGETGTGKTTIARKYLQALYEEEPFHQDGTKWWDNYKGQSGVLVDEFDGSWVYRQWKLICDRCPVDVEVKGGKTAFLGKTIIFCSNMDPFDWWPNLPATRWGEIIRRCDGIILLQALAQLEDRWVQSRIPKHGQDLPCQSQGEGRIWD